MSATGAARSRILMFVRGSASSSLHQVPPWTERSTECRERKNDKSPPCLRNRRFSWRTWKSLRNLRLKSGFIVGFKVSKPTLENVWGFTQTDSRNSNYDLQILVGTTQVSSIVYMSYWITFTVTLLGLPFSSTCKETSLSISWVVT